MIFEFYEKKYREKVYLKLKWRSPLKRKDPK